MNEGLPRVVLRDPEDEVVGVLRSLQTAVLKHPVAAQSIFSALIEEGRRFSETPSGVEWKTKLSHSPLLHRARVILEMSTLWMLEEDSPDVLPSGYLDAVFMAASSPDLEPLMNQLFEEMTRHAP
jgi:hypothetical protein